RRRVLSGAGLVSVAGLVLERDREPDAIALDSPVLDRNVLPEDLGDAQIANRFRRGLHRAARSGLPGLTAHPNHFGHSVDAISHRNHPSSTLTPAPSHISSGREGLARACRGADVSAVRPATARALRPSC